MATSGESRPKRDDNVAALAGNGRLAESESIYDVGMHVEFKFTTSFIGWLCVPNGPVPSR